MELREYFWRIQKLIWEFTNLEFRFIFNYVSRAIGN